MLADEDVHHEAGTEDHRRVVADRQLVHLLSEGLAVTHCYSCKYIPRTATVLFYLQSLNSPYDTGLP